VHRTRRESEPVSRARHGLGSSPSFDSHARSIKAPRRLVIIGIEGERFDLGERSECFGRSGRSRSSARVVEFIKEAQSCRELPANVLENDGPKRVVASTFNGLIRERPYSLSTALPGTGDWVVVHSGYVIDRLDAADAQRPWARSVVASEISPTR